MDNCIKTGAYVELVDYGRYAPIDIFEVGETFVIQFNGDPTEADNFFPQRPVTHRLFLNRNTNYWQPHHAVAVVQSHDLEEV